jgi:nitroreductase
MIEELVRKNRSYRRFQENRSIDKETLQGLINLARLSPSAGNLQPLKYVLSNTPEKNNLIFPCLSWAAYLKEWHGPQEGERPTAYVVVLGDTDITRKFGCGHGIAAQSILLGATERGLNGCIVGSIRRKMLREALGIPERYEILIVIAMGVRKEMVVIEEVKDGDIKYWRDDKGVHHVPKRSLSEIILDL